ncbi:MAG: F0F1 ATP synthase subunit A [Bacteroidota bacterium]
MKINKSIKLQNIFGKKLIFLIFVLLLAISLPSNLTAQHEEDTHEKTEKKFKPGPFIFDHIADSYEWHIFTVGETHISLPLPIILYSKSKGLNVFMSSKFHHGHDVYKGFKIELEETSKNKGKIVELMGNGDFEKPLINISITKNVVALFFSVALMLFIFISVANAYKKNKGQAPKGMQSFFEPLILFVRDDIAKASIQNKPEKYMPYLLSIFFFIVLNNLLGLIPILPGGANLTGNITITLALAVFTFVITTVKGNKAYWTHIFNAPGVPWWLKIPVPLMPVVEIVGMFTKPFVLMVRLFANITAGHIIALGFYSLIFIFGEKNIFAGYGISIVSILFTVFMMVLELLVAFIQAYVFTLLSALYFGMATEEHH